MPDLPILKPYEVARLREARGFVLVRQRGSHMQYRHPDGRGTTIPFHASRDIAPSLLHRIARDVGLSVDGLVRPAG